MIPSLILQCDERCAPTGRCYDLTVDSPEGPRLVAMVHWRIVPFVQDAKTGALTQVPDDGSTPFCVENIHEYPLLAEVRGA